MPQQVHIEITINGKKITPFTRLSLRQHFNEHHYFEVQFNHEVLEQAGTMTIDASKSYLGKAITIAFNDLSKSGTQNSFKGIVTDIQFASTLNNAGDIIFSGYSPTILLDNGEANSSYLDRSLTQVIKDISGQVAGNDLTIKTAPVKKSNIAYITQYRESNFNFLRRLAAEYGEHFFYDGAALNFGKPAQASEISLQYPKDISDLNLRVKVAPVGFEQIGYLSKEDKKAQSASSSAQVAGLDTLGKFALSESDKVFGSKPSTLAKRKYLTANDLDEAVKISKSTKAADLTVVRATSDSPFIKLGATVQIKAGKADYGKFTVISVNHTTDGFGNYENEFEGVPSTVAVMPSPYYKKPIAEPQIGIVKKHDDPDNLGKVQVQLLWQKDTATTPYIRVLSPSGGTYGDGKKTRGMFFTPEVGDYVVVGFTQNDPDRPFVMGALPHGKAIDSSETSAKNNVKSLSTRNGNIISFTDKDKENIIKIQTDDTNYITIHLKDKDGTVSIYSSKAIDVHSKETIVVKAGKKIDIQAGEEINIQGDKTLNIKSEAITIDATKTIEIKANKEITIKATDVKIEGSKGFEAKGGATAKVEGAQLEVKGSATAKVEGGAKLDLQGGAMATLKGGIVQIN